MSTDVTVLPRMMDPMRLLWILVVRTAETELGPPADIRTLAKTELRPPMPCIGEFLVPIVSAEVR